MLTDIQQAGIKVTPDTSEEEKVTGRILSDHTVEESGVF